MAQSRKPKLSRRAKAVWAGRGNHGIDSEVPSDVYEEIRSAEQYPRRQQLLFDLTNMRDDGLEWFWSRWRGNVRPERDADISRLRDELRSFWKDPTSSDTHII